MPNSRVDDNGDEYKAYEVEEGDNKQRSILCFAFEDGKDLYKRPPNLIEHGKSLVAGKEMLGLRRHEIRMLDKYNRHFLKVQGIGTTESKKATRKFMELTRSAKDDFAEYEVNNRGKMKFTPLTDKSAHQRDHILRNLSEQLFTDVVTGRMLNSYMTKNKKWIDELYENDLNNDHKKFMENYKALTKLIIEKKEKKANIKVQF